MKKRLFALLCALVLLTTAIPSAGALAGEANRSADILSTLGLVNGTTNAGYDLTAPATRAQAAVLLVRLAGAGEAAAADPWFAGYRDVPSPPTPGAPACCACWVTAMKPGTFPCLTPPSLPSGSA